MGCRPLGFLVFKMLIVQQQFVQPFMGIYIYHFGPFMVIVDHFCPFFVNAFPAGIFAILAQADYNIVHLFYLGCIFHRIWSG